MTPSKLRQRLAESEGAVDPEEYVTALQYVRGDPTRRLEE